MRIKPVLAWYDMWVGVFWDRQGRRLYILPLPCCGVCIELGAGSGAVVVTKKFL